MVYTASEATAGPGFLLDFEEPLIPGTWTHVAEILDINGPDESTDEVEVTNQDSTENWKEFLATMQDGGNVTFDLNLVPGNAGQTALADLKHNRTTVNWRIRMADTGYGTYFAGFVNKLGRVFPVQGKMTRAAGIRVSGAVTEAPYLGS